MKLKIKLTIIHNYNFSCGDDNNFGGIPWQSLRKASKFQRMKHLFQYTLVQYKN